MGSTPCANMREWKCVVFGSSQLWFNWLVAANLPALERAVSFMCLPQGMDARVVSCSNLAERTNHTLHLEGVYTVPRDCDFEA